MRAPELLSTGMRIVLSLGMVVVWACSASPRGGAGDDAGTTPDDDADPSLSMCTNYTPPDLPDSQLVWRDTVALAAIDGLTHFSVSGSATTNSAGKLTRFTHDEAGTDNDFTVDFFYNSAGRLSRRTYDAAGATNDITDDFQYTSTGRLSRWDHQADGAANDTTDDFQYTSSGRLSRWEHRASGATGDVTDDFSYTRHDLISRFTHQVASAADNLTEDFSYDAFDRLTRWQLDRTTGEDIESTFSYGACQH
jgi:hypothetical protein